MKTLLTLFTFLYSLTLFGQIPSQVPTNGLVAYYSFKGNTLNSVGPLNGGIPHNISLTTDRFGYTNSAYQFNGINSYINVGTIHSPSFTYSIWIYVDTTTKLSSFISRISSFINNSNAEINLDTIQGLSGMGVLGGKVGYNYYTQVGQNSSTGPYFGSFNPAFNTQVILNNKTWYHVALSYNSVSKKTSIYINGTLITQNNTIGNANISFAPSSYNYDQTTSLYIGARPIVNNTVGNFFKGKLDDVAIYNIALPDSSITKLYTINSSGVGIIYDTITVQDTVIVMDTVWSYQTDTNLVNVYDTTNITIFDTTHITHITHIDTIQNSDTLFVPFFITNNSQNKWNVLRMYPNPTNSIIKIDCGNHSLLNGYTFKIVNSMGQIVYENTITQQYYEIPLIEFGDTGIYNVIFQNSLGELITTKKIALY